MSRTFGTARTASDQDVQRIKRWTPCGVEQWDYGGWVIDMDIQGFFDALDHSHLRNFLDQRIRDGVLRRVIGKWLNAGVMEGGMVTHGGIGSPQGGVVSPLLANIYLHELLDKWLEDVVRPRMRGHVFLIRYADDAIIVCANGDDAQRVMAVLPKRLGRFGLTLHPDKTRLVEFVRPWSRPGGPRVGPQPGSFDFLGFTHFWAGTQKGKWAVRRKTSKERFNRAVTSLAAWCRLHLHLPIREQHRILSLKLRGHFGYYGITWNSNALARFRHRVRQVWRKWLGRRGGRRYMTWERFTLLEQRYPLPLAVRIHSVYVTQRNHDSKSRMR